MSEFDTNKILNDHAKAKCKEFYDFFTSPDAIFRDRKATDWVQFKQTNYNVEFTYLSWDFAITTEINAYNNSCVLKTNRLVLDENDYPKKKLQPIPDMDIIIKLPYNSPESFRFMKNIMVEKPMGKKPDGSPNIMSQNTALISNLPIQYINQLSAEMKRMQTT